MKRSTKRRIDDLGRITVPADFRKELGIEAGDVLEVYMEDGKIEEVYPSEIRFLDKQVDQYSYEEKDKEKEGTDKNEKITG